MDRENAEKIARRIMDRVEQDRALHLDALVEEIMAGFALVEPQGYGLWGEALCDEKCDGLYKSVDATGDCTTHLPGLGNAVTHHESDPMSRYRTKLLTAKEPPHAAVFPDNGFTAKFAEDRGWSPSIMASNGYVWDESSGIYWTPSALKG